MTRETYREEDTAPQLKTKELTEGIYGSGKNTASNATDKRDLGLGRAKGTRSRCPSVGKTRKKKKAERTAWKKRIFRGSKRAT